MTKRIGMADAAYNKHQRGLDVRAAITKATGLRKVGGRWMGERGPSVTRKSPKFKLTLEEKLRRRRANKLGGGGGIPMNLKTGGRGIGGRKTPWRKRKILE